jgi:hypothetical protein
MVYYSNTAKDDLRDMLWGLATWHDYSLGYEHAMLYVEDIRNICDKLDAISIHFDAKYTLHKQYGEKAYTYQRNKNTTWYIIYNTDIFDNVFIEKILNNHLTMN